jgi:uncharacterized repeat protein (TIGR03803 family)
MRADISTLLVALLISMQPAWSQTYKLLHSLSPAEGVSPSGRLLRDNRGNLYGTASEGGAHNYGTVFKINSVGNATVLYSFSGGSDGATPYSGLIPDAQGNLYGTTYAGGSGYGTVFEITGTGQESVLYTFSGTDGANPRAGLVLDSEGNLYGTTYAGGAFGLGTVFELTPGGQETVLHSFAGIPDGSSPYFGSLVLDSQGNLYGTTLFGGSNGDYGTVFEITAAGEEQILYSFCSVGNCWDGEEPFSGLVRDSAGNLYGTTSAGGYFDYGTAFILTLAGSERSVNFPGKQYGINPSTALTLDAKGDAYGATVNGGSANDGVVYKLSRNGGGVDENVLYNFGSGGTDDGTHPHADLLLDNAHNLYGTTTTGGTYGGGTVFEITP